MPAEVTDRTSSSARDAVQRLAERLLEILGLEACELAVSLVDDADIRRLNQTYRGRDRPTDVLSFAQLDPAGGDQCEGAAAAAGERLLGDIVISVETAAEQGARGGWSLEEELGRLVLHGLLHLLGYDHEAGPTEAARMSAEEQRLAAALVAAGHPCAREELAR